jgi:hypothetical protein
MSRNKKGVRTRFVPLLFLVRYERPFVTGRFSKFALYVGEKYREASTERRMEMKNTAYLILAALLVFSTSTLSDYAYGGGGGYHGGGYHGGYHGGGYHGGYHGGGYYRGSGWVGGVWIGPGWGWGAWGPWWGAPYYPYYPYYPSPYYASPPVVVQQQAPVYDQPPPQQNYWYYCQESRAYYPYVKECPKGWVKVVPSPGPPDVQK